MLYFSSAVVLSTRSFCNDPNEAEIFGRKTKNNNKEEKKVVETKRKKREREGEREREREREKERKVLRKEGFVKTNGTLFSAGNSRNSAPCCYSTGMRVANQFTGLLSLEKVALRWPIAS